MELTFDLPVDAPLDENALDGNSKVQPGWYLARIEDIYPDPENPAMKLKFELIGEGPFKGKHVPDTLWDPREAEDEEKGKKTQERLLMITRRIGAREENSTRINFADAIGKEVVLHLARPQTKRCNTCREDAPKGFRKGKCERCGRKYDWVENPNDFANVTWDGVYPPDHDKIPDEVRKALGITVAKRAPRVPDGAKTQPAAAAAPSRPTTPKTSPTTAATASEPNIDDL